MGAAVKVSILVPVWNEADRIPSCMDRILSFVSTKADMTWEILVCADGCTDATLDIANQYASEHNQVKVAYYPQRLGKGGGILHGSEIAAGDVIVIADVDLSAPPDQILKVVSALSSEQADLVVGSRNMPGSTITEKSPTHRVFLGRALNFLFRLLFHADFHDTQCGLKAIKTTVFRDLRHDLGIEGYAFDLDLIVKAMKMGYKVIETPIVWGYRRGSKVGSLHDSFAMARSLMIVWLQSQKTEVLRPVDEHKLRDFYDSVAGDTYDRAVRSPFLPRRLWHEAKNRYILQSLSKGQTILDAGCGSGVIIQPLLEMGDIYGIDLGKGFAKFCQDRYGHSKNAAFLLADARHVPFRTETFDCVICSEVLEHVYDPARALKEFSRILRPSGRLVLTTPNISIRWSLLEAIWTRVRHEIIEIGHTAFTERKVRYLLSMTDLEVLNCRTILLGCVLLLVAEKKRETQVPESLTQCVNTDSEQGSGHAASFQRVRAELERMNCLRLFENRVM